MKKERKKNARASITIAPNEDIVPRRVLVLMESHRIKIHSLKWRLNDRSRVKKHGNHASPVIIMYHYSIVRRNEHKASRRGVLRFILPCRAAHASIYESRSYLCNGYCDRTLKRFQNNCSEPSHVTFKEFCANFSNFHRNEQKELNPLKELRYRCNFNSQAL